MDKKVDWENIKAAKTRLSKELLGKYNVNGVGISVRGGISVHLVNEEYIHKIPTKWEGFDVYTTVVGEIYAL